MKLAKILVFAGGAGILLNALTLFLKYQGIFKPAPVAYDWMGVIMMALIFGFGIRELSICKKKREEDESLFK